VDAADIPRLARLWDERLRRDISRFDVPAPEIAARGSVLRAPAGAQDVAEAERSRWLGGHEPARLAAGA
jgi:hypothetical protein